MLYKTEGIILKRADLGEADRLLTIYTKKFGKIRLLAKGVKKIEGKLRGHLEPFSHSQLIFVKGRSLDIITDAVLINYFSEIRQDIEKINSAYYITELTDKLISGEEGDRRIWKLLISVLENLSHLDKEKIPLLLHHFELKSLSFLGYSPELKRCVSCYQSHKDPISLFFSAALGGILCHNCLKNDTQRIIKISSDILKILGIFQEEDFDIVKRFNLSFSQERKLGEIIRYFLSFILETDWSKTRFLW